MSVENFIPEVTQAEIQVAYDREKVVIATFTPVPEGDIRVGNAVKIVGAELPTVQDYKANGRRFDADEVILTDVTVLIDQEKIVPTRIDNIDERQVAGTLSKYTDLQGPSLAKDAEQYAVRTLIEGATQGSTTAVTTGTAAATVSANLAEALDTAEVPAEGRYLLTNAKGKALLRAALAQSSATQATGDELRKNVIGELDGFTVIWSTNFPSEITGAAFVAYHSAAVAFADQIAESRAVPATDGHADIVSTLNVYGAKVTRPAGVHVAGFDQTIVDDGS